MSNCNWHRRRIEARTESCQGHSWVNYVKKLGAGTGKQEKDIVGSRSAGIQAKKDLSIQI